MSYVPFPPPPAAGTFPHDLCRAPAPGPFCYLRYDYAPAPAAVVDELGRLGAGVGALGRETERVRAQVRALRRELRRVVAELRDAVAGDEGASDGGDGASPKREPRPDAASDDKTRRELGPDAEPPAVGDVAE